MVSELCVTAVARNTEVLPFRNIGFRYVLTKYQRWDRYHLEELLTLECLASASLPAIAASSLIARIPMIPFKARFVCKRRGPAKSSVETSSF